MVSLLLIAVMVQAAGLLLCASSIYFILRDSRKDRQELLDRLMARDFSEYRTWTQPKTQGPLRRRAMTDEVEARIEAERLARQAGTPS